MLVMQYTVAPAGYQSLIDFILQYPIWISEYPSPPSEVAILANSQPRPMASLIVPRMRQSSPMGVAYLRLAINAFDYIMDYGTLCLNIRNTDIRMRSITMQTRDGDHLLKAFEIARIRNLKLRINHPPGLQDALKIIKFTNELSLENRQALDFYARNSCFFPDMELNVTMPLSVSSVIEVIKSNKFHNLRSINISIYDKEVNEDTIADLLKLIRRSPTNLILNCHVTYPSLSELTFINDTTMSSGSLKLLDDFHREHRDKSNLSYEVFLFFVDNGQQFTELIDCSKVHQLYVCHPGPSTADFRRLDWEKFTGLKQMHVKVLHLFLDYLNECIPSHLQRLKLNFGSFRADMRKEQWVVPASIIELEVDTFPTGEGPMELLLSSTDWSQSQVKKLCLCWNKVFDARGHMILLVNSLPNSLELLDIAGCGYEVVLICNEVLSFMKSEDEDTESPTIETRRVYYSGEYGSVIINNGDNQYPLAWMGKA